MRYLIIPKDSEPFMTNWFNPENWVEGMIVFDTYRQELFSSEGWKVLTTDNL